MPLIRVDGPSLGTAGRDLMVDLPGGRSDSVMRGDGGNDILFGDWDAIVDNGRSDGNASIATALSLDDPALWARGINHFLNLNGPHITIFLEPGAGQERFYELALTAGQTIMGDSWDFAYAGGSIQHRGGLSIELLGADGSVLRTISSSTVFVIPADGTYYLRISEPVSGSPAFEGDEAHLVTLRVAGHEATAPVASAGRDMLYGGPGDDSLFGFGGNDTLRGNSGNDNMYGGRGNDTFYIEQSFDIVHEYAGEGTDTVIALADYYMSLEEVEIVRLGAPSLYVRGNDASTTFYGSNGNDVIEGAGGDDILVGNAGRDTLLAGEGANIIIGGSGADHMSGGSGADIFRYLDLADLHDPTDPLAWDLISQFHPQDGDLIDLSAIDPIPGGADDAFIYIGGAAFTGHAGEIRFVKGQTGPCLRFDLDGDGRADAVIDIPLDQFNATTVENFGASMIL